MTITTVPTAVTGEVFSAADYNTQVRDNINGIWVLTTAGDMLYATGAGAAARLAKGPLGSSMRMGSSYPEWVPFHAAKGLRTSSLAVTSGLQTLIAFESASPENGISWDAGDPTKMIIGRTGYYLVMAYSSWAAAVGGYREIQITYNGSFVHDARIPNASGEATHFSTGDIMSLSAAGILRLYVRQNSGSNVDIQKAWLAAVFLGEY